MDRGGVYFRRAMVGHSLDARPAVWQSLRSRHVFVERYEEVGASSRSSAAMWLSAMPSPTTVNQLPKAGRRTVSVTGSLRLCITLRRSPIVRRIGTVHFAQQ